MARLIGDIQLGVYAAPSYLARVGTPLHPRELKDMHHRIVRLLWARTGKTLGYTMQLDGESVQVQGHYALSVDDGNAHLAAGLAGLGMLWLPHYMAMAHLASGELVRLFEGWQIDPMPLYIAFATNRHASAKLRVFIEWVAGLTAQHALAGKRP